jgi:glycine/D-amino acid oxidase-like deaminating enzyme
MAGMTEHVLVIGGGILGSSAAYRLACGVWVTLLDRADQGHATAAGAGIVSPATSFSAPPAQNALAYRADAYYPGLVASLLIGADAVILATGGWDDGWAAQLPFRTRGGTGHHAVRGWRTGWARPG